MNASLVKFLIDDGLDALRLTQLRFALAICILAAWLLWRRTPVRPGPVRDLGAFVVGGMALAAASAGYFFAIARIEIGVAATIQYLFPLFIVLWLGVVHRRRLGPVVWLATATSLAGTFLVARAWDAGSLDLLAVGSALVAAVGGALYVVCNEHAAGSRDRAVALLFWFSCALAVLALIAPPWSFPFGFFGSAEHLGLGLGVTLLGTLMPFALVALAVEYIPSSRVAVLLTAEIVFGALGALWLHSQSLTAIQIAGGALVALAIATLQTRAPSPEESMARPEAAAAR